MREKGSICRQAGIAPIIVVVIVAVAALGVSSVAQNTDQNVKGELIAKGGDSEQSRNDNDSSGGSSGSGSGGSTETKTTTEGGVRVETKTSPTKEKTEIRFSETERIKTRTEEGETRVEVRSGGTKVRYELKDGQLKIKVENEKDEGDEIENEIEVEDEEEEIEKAEQELEEEDIEIATLSGKLVLAKNKVAASTNLPIFVNPETKQLTVTTPAGERVVTILPDQAVKNMLAANVISRLSQTQIADAAISGELASVEDVIELGLRSNLPVYEIPGVKDFKLLGFIPVSSPLTAVVSAETGELVTTEQPLLTNILDLLSP